MTRLVHLLYLLLTVSAIGYSAFVGWLSVSTRFNLDLICWNELLFSLLGTTALISIPICSVKVLLNSNRFKASILLLLSVLVIVSNGLGAWFGHRVRTTEIKNFTDRSQKLISALKKYEHDHESLPESLEDLVPAYLPSMPTTEMVAYPDYEYHKGYAGNPWALSVFTPKGLLNFDQIVYLPNQNYEELPFPEQYERIGDWAYVHE